MDITSKQPFPEWRFLQLTLAIIGWLLVSPQLEARWSGHLALQILLLDLILVTLWANPGWRVARHLVGALWLLSVGASVVAVTGALRQWNQVDRLVELGLTVPVTVACVVGVLTFAFRAERPTVDGIFAMVVAYFLLSMAFTELYYMAIVWNPDALHLLKPVAELTPREIRGQLTYFSLVTISTVGYGDILAVSPTVRMLATVEAVMGQFYVAVVVATFVGMWAAQATAAAGVSKDARRGRRD
jgi:hypothetical protein